MSKPKCKYCQTEDLAKLITRVNARTGYQNLCYECNTKIKGEIALRKRLLKPLFKLWEDHLLNKE